MIVIPFLVAFLVAFVSAPFFRKLALALNILDHPATRKLQKAPVPLLGGGAVFCGVACGSLLMSLHIKAILSLFCAGTLIFFVSVLDDKYGLSARSRIIAQLAAAGILMAAGLRISFLPNNMLGDAGEILITLIWILGITNAFNCLDGVDGLCAGLGAVASVFFAFILLSTGQKSFLFLPLSVAGGCLGFMPHNLKKDKIFLGDGGSMFIGFLMAGIALLGNWASDDFIKISVPILILGVPIFDMTFTTIMRYREKKIRTLVQWLEYAGRDHFHHYLMDLGLKSHGAAFFIFAVSVSLGISALIITKSDHAYYGILTILKTVILFGLISVLMILGRRLQKENLVRERMGY